MKLNGTAFLSESAVANPHLAADGLLSIDAIIKAGVAQDKAVEKSNAALEAAGKPVAKQTGCYVISTKAKPGKYSAASAKKRDFKYLATRLVKVAERKRTPKEGVSVVLFKVYDKLPKELAAKQRQMVAAVTSHSKTLEKEAAKIKNEKADIRDAANAAFDAAVSTFKGLLANLPDAVKKSARFDPERDMVEASGMFGKTVLLKVSKDQVISIGKSDLTKFNAAKRAANASQSSDMQSESAGKPLLAECAAQIEKLEKKFAKQQARLDAIIASYNKSTPLADQAAAKAKAAAIRDKMKADPDYAALQKLKDKFSNLRDKRIETASKSEDPAVKAALEKLMAYYKRSNVNPRGQTPEERNKARDTRLFELRVLSIDLEAALIAPKPKKSQSSESASEFVS